MSPLFAIAFRMPSDDALINLLLLLVIFAVAASILFYAIRENPVFVKVGTAICAMGAMASLLKTTQK